LHVERGSLRGFIGGVKWYDVVDLDQV